jgi:hypothetical protein
MTKHHILTKTIASVSLAAALVAGAGNAAGAQTREHILLARQVGVPTVQVELRAGSAVKQIAAGSQDTAGSTDGEPCADWTNEDGTHGTNCPTGGGGTGGRKLIWDYIRSNG